MPITILNVVVFPAPLRPKRPTMLLWPTDMLTLSTTVLPEYFFTNCRVSRRFVFTKKAPFNINGGIIPAERAESKQQFEGGERWVHFTFTGGFFKRLMAFDAMSCSQSLFSQIIRKANTADEPARLHIIPDCFKRFPHMFRGMIPVYDKRRSAKMSVMLSANPAGS